jgi:hypothetical protein
MTPFIDSSFVKPSITDWHHSFLQMFTKYRPVLSLDCKTITVSGMLVGSIKRTAVEEEILPHWTQKCKKEENHNAYSQLSFGRKLKAIFPRLLTESEVICEDEDMERNECTAHLLLGILLSRINTKSSRLAQEESEQTTALGELSTLPGGWDLAQLSDSAMGNSLYRTVAETESMELCFVPHWAKPKDVVYQFAGCSVPAVLRRCNQEGFTFIGDCYVYRKPPGKIVSLLEQVVQEGRELERLVLFR